jgi:hypothetical protein
LPVTGRREPLTIVPVRTRAQARDFHRLVAPLYRDDPNYIPPLLLERRLHFSPRHNPFFEHAEMAWWLAYRGGQPVGRITAQIDRLHLERHHDATGHFGFLEAVDDDEVFAALLRQAEDWLREHGLQRVLGPVSFSLWDQPGLLVDGFDTPPFVLMGHALPYFQGRIESAGYAPAQDLVAYEYTREMVLPPVVERAIARAGQRGELTIRNVRKDRKNIAAEIALILDILNDGWSENWGFVPMTPAEAADMATLLRIMGPADHLAIAEYKGRAAAFCLVIPNFNEAIRDLRGRLAPFGWAKLLWRLKVKGVKSSRMAMMGVRREMQTSPMGAALALAVLAATRAASIAYGARTGELSWVLDGNDSVKHIIDVVGAKPTKRYRIYEKSL